MFFPTLILGDRPKVIHKDPCEHCPSAPHREQDPEAQDMGTAPRDQQLAFVFPCGWRPNKLCKGLCDRLNVTEKDLK